MSSITLVVTARRLAEGAQTELVRNSLFALDDGYPVAEVASAAGVSLEMLTKWREGHLQQDR